jgi:uncharacterized membrane protein HdeD (DUF308 family)
MKKVSGIILFLTGIILGVSTRGNYWIKYPIGVFILVYILAFILCTAGIALWKLDTSKNNDDHF